MHVTHDNQFFVLLLYIIVQTMTLFQRPLLISPCSKTVRGVFSRLGFESFVDIRHVWHGKSENTKMFVCTNVEYARKTRIFH